MTDSVSAEEISMNKATIKHIITIVLFISVSVVLALYVSRYINVVDKPVLSDETDKSQNTEETSKKTIEGSIWGDIDDDSDDAIEETSTETSKCVLKQTDDAGSQYLEQLIFIGDATIKQFGRFVFTGLPNPIYQVWYSEGDNIDCTKMGLVTDFNYPMTGENISFIDAVKDAAPPYVILTFGSYSENEFDEYEFISAYASFITSIRAVSPNTDIIIQSILPVSSDCEVVTNEEIVKRNKLLIELCEKYEIYYVDSWSALIDEDGVLYADYAGNSGYTMNESGYRKMLEYIRFHAHPSFGASEEVISEE